MREELDRARLSLVERKTVDRAKGLLMEQKALSEEAAYKLLRKLAMDQNKRIGEVAARDRHLRQGAETLTVVLSVSEGPHRRWQPA